MGPAAGFGIKPNGLKPPAFIACLTIKRDLPGLFSGDIGLSQRMPDQIFIALHRHGLKFVFEALSRAGTQAVVAQDLETERGDRPQRAFGARVLRKEGRHQRCDQQAHKRPANTPVMAPGGHFRLPSSRQTGHV